MADRPTNRYIVTFTSMVIEADSPDEAIDRAGEFKGGGHWEATPVGYHVARSVNDDAWVVCWGDAVYEAAETEAEAHQIAARLAAEDAQEDSTE